MDYIIDNLIRPSLGRANYVWKHQGFQKYFRNTGWMLVARIISFITSFFTVIIVARYLGPENLGKFEYAQSFVAIISVFASLGIDQILYRDLIAKPDKENGLLGTAFFSKTFFGVIAFLISVSISISIGNDLIYNILIAICSLTFITSPLGILAILFNAKVKSKYVSIVSIFIAFIIPLLKLLVVFIGGGIIFFSLTILAESIINSAAFLLIYVTKFNGRPFSWNFDLNIFKKLMRDSWPLLIASLSGYVYAKMDQVMILHYLDPKNVGIYSAAVKVTQMWIFIPGLIISSLFPAIVNAYKTNFNSYAKRFKRLFLSTNIIIILVSIPIYFFSYFIIKIIFGISFIEAAPILRIYVWASVAINLFVLSQHYLIVENLEKIFLYASLIGAMVNIILNIILIPMFGPYGAAIATLISYISLILSIFLFKKSRNGILKILNV